MAPDITRTYGYDIALGIDAESYEPEYTGDGVGYAFTLDQATKAKLVRLVCDHLSNVSGLETIEGVTIEPGYIRARVIASHNPTRRLSAGDVDGAIRAGMAEYNRRWTTPGADGEPLDGVSHKGNVAYATFRPEGATSPDEYIPEHCPGPEGDIEDYLNGEPLLRFSDRDTQHSDGNRRYDDKSMAAVAIWPIANPEIFVGEPNSTRYSEWVECFTWEPEDVEQFVRAVGKSFAPCAFTVECWPSHFRIEAVMGGSGQTPEGQTVNPFKRPMREFDMRRRPLDVDANVNRAIKRPKIDLADRYYIGVEDRSAFIDDWIATNGLDVTDPADVPGLDADAEEDEDADAPDQLGGFLDSFLGG